MNLSSPNKLYAPEPVLEQMLALLNCLRIIIMYYTYVLQSEKDGKMYSGYTKNLKLRFDQHSRGAVESTKERRPLNLIYYEACNSKKDALKREKYFKIYHGKMFLNKRLKSYLTG